jgi:hypothetical protein
MLDYEQRVLAFYLLVEPSGLPRPCGLRADVVSPPDVGIRGGREKAEHLMYRTYLNHPYQGKDVSH